MKDPDEKRSLLQSQIPTSSVSDQLNKQKTPASCEDNRAICRKDNDENDDHDTGYETDRKVCRRRVVKMGRNGRNGRMTRILDREEFDSQKQHLGETRYAQTQWQRARAQPHSLDLEIASLIPRPSGNASLDLEDGPHFCLSSATIQTEDSRSPTNHQSREVKHINKVSLPI